jgi:putative FmdB family regulatory protein
VVGGGVETGKGLAVPTYEYECPGCGEKFEVERKITDETLVCCPECGTIAQRLISATSFSLRGSNWGKDSYGLVPPKEKKG